MTRSRWRRASQQAIETALEDRLGVDCMTEAQLRKVIDAAYPFGERAHHPYKVWLKVVREEMARRGFRKQAKPDTEPHFRLLHGVLAYSGLKRCDWWLELRCDYCEKARTLTRGCLLCASLQDQLDALVNTDEWRHWLKQVRADATVALIFADWLEERGYDEVAHLFRTTAPPEKKT